jgi:hypothetical protein
VQIGFFAKYFWVIVKNCIGWMLMIAALVLGGVFPEPIGTPLFLIGFALISFPGKRSLTSRVFRGIPYDLYTHQMRVIRAAISLIFPPIAVWILAHQKHSILHPHELGAVRTFAIYALAVGGSWLGLLWLMRFMNLVIRFLPRVRRKVRPWMKEKGINLLPARKRRISRFSPHTPPNQEIIEITSPSIVRAQGAWNRFWGRFKRQQG